MPSKTCTKCGLEKSFDDFYNESCKPDGKKKLCKVCCEKNKKEKPGNVRKYTWDFDFFKRQTPETAYWAGFLFADGSIRNRRANGNKGELKLQLAEKDRDHIERFCDCIGLDRSAIKEDSSRGFKPGSSQPYVCLQHVNLLEDLRPWGVVPNKTYQWTEPSVAAELIPHYLRGWLDGDGFINPRQRFISLVNLSCEAVSWFAAQALSDINPERRHLEHNGGQGHYVIFRTSQCINLLRAVDWQNPLRLDRKYRHIDPALAHWRADYKGHALTADQAKLLRQGLSWSNAA